MALDLLSVTQTEQAAPVATVMLAATSRHLPVLSPNPIPPEWIVAGEPEARAVELTAGGTTRCSSGLWACTAGTFDWHFPADEIIRILNGSVRLRFDDGRELTATTGDVVSFRGGSVVRWEIPEYLEKFWVLGPVPNRFGRVLRRARRAAATIGR